MADELHNGELFEPARGHDPAVPFAIASGALLALGGLAVLGRPGKRRKSFGLLAILASVAIYLLRSQPTRAEPAVWVPFEEPAKAEAPEAETSIPEEPEPEPDELLPAAQAGVEAEDETVLESSGWHVIAEAREQGRARVDSDRPFVLLQPDESEQPEEIDEEPAAAHRAIGLPEPVEGVVNRVGLYSSRPDELLEPAEAEGF